MTDTALWTKSIHSNPCQSRESNPAPLAPQSEVLPLDHRKK